MNKKILVFSLMGLFMFSLVAAISYYAVFSTTFTVTPAVTVDGIEPKVVEGTSYGGEPVEGNVITITNDAPSLRTISIIDDSGEEVDVVYVSELVLAKKVVAFGEDGWALAEEEDAGEVTVKYTVVGESFTAEVTTPFPDYELIYYMDEVARFDNPTGGEDVVTGNLPYDEDENKDLHNYCELDEYTTCYGAKLWYVPSDAILVDGLNWNMASDFYFETNMIQYNNAGKIIVYPGSSLTITPYYTPSNYANGSYEITTTIA